MPYELTPNLFDVPVTRRRLTARERAAAYQVLRYALVMDAPAPHPDRLEAAKEAMNKLKPLKRRK